MQESGPSYSGRRRSPRGSRLAVVFCVALAATVCLHAQTRVSLTASQTEPFVNESVLVEIEVKDFTDCQAPQFPDLPGCSVTSAGPPAESTQTILTPGRQFVTRSRTYSFEVTPTRPGVVEIPPIEVVVDGRTFRTQPQSLRVVDASGLIEARIACSAPRLYVGQVAPFTLTITVRAADVNGRPLDASTMYRQIDPRGDGFPPFPGATNYTTVRRKDAGGAEGTYYQFTMPADWLLKQPGVVTFDDLDIRVRYPVRFGRDVFRDLYISEYRVLRAVPAIDAPTVEPLPTAGRPAGFHGAVGTFKLRASAQPTSVRVGDPIQLTIEVSGVGPLATLPPPPLGAQENLLAGFRVPQEDLSGSFERGVRRFTQTIRVKRSDVKEVPPIEYPYFDPSLGQYAVARSDAIPLTVAAGEQLDYSEFADAQALAAQSPAVTARDGLRGNVLDETALLSSTSTVTWGQLVAVAAGPPAAFAAGWAALGLLARRNPNDPRRRRQLARKRALQRLAAARTVLGAQRWRAIESALAGYLADCLNEPPARFTGRSAVQHLRTLDLPDDRIEQWSRVVEHCEQAAYAGLDVSGDDWIERAGECVLALERDGTLRPRAAP